MAKTPSAEPPKVPRDRPGPEGGRRDRNRRRRTQDLLDAGLDLFLERGIATVTIDEITRKAGVAKGSFYRYFDDKTHLVQSIIEPTADALRSAMAACAEALAEAESADEVTAAYTLMALRLSSVAFAQRGPVRLYLQEHRSPGQEAEEVLGGLAAELDRRAIELSEVAVDYGLIEVEDPRVSALAVVGAVEHLALAVLRQELHLDPSRVAQVLIRTVLEGIATG